MDGVLSEFPLFHANKIIKENREENNSINRTMRLYLSKYVSNLHPTKLLINSFAIAVLKEKNKNSNIHYMSIFDVSFKTSSASSPLLFLRLLCHRLQIVCCLIAFCFVKIKS